MKYEESYRLGHNEKHVKTVTFIGYSVCAVTCFYLSVQRNFVGSPEPREIGMGAPFWRRPYKTLLRHLEPELITTSRSEKQYGNAPLPEFRSTCSPSLQFANNNVGPCVSMGPRSFD